MTPAVIGTMLALLLTLLPGRAAAWPQWVLPAPLRPAGRADLIYPDWFDGCWSISDEGDPELRYSARFIRYRGGAVVGDRSFNAAAVGQALLGKALLEVETDPANPNRQLARLRGDQLLESTVVARNRHAMATEFWSDELSLQVVHQPQAEPRVSRVETLSHYRRQDDGSISAEQWQATYPSPAEGLAAAPLRSSHWEFRLQPADPESPGAS